MAMTDTATGPDPQIVPPFFFIGCFLAASFWVLEAYFDSVLIENESFATRLFPSDMNELWMRGLVSVLFLGFGLYSRIVYARIRAAEKLNLDAAWLLKNALSKTIRGNYPICVFCRKIRDQEGQWVAPDKFIAARTEAEFAGSLCGECQAKHPVNESPGERHGK